MLRELRGKSKEGVRVVSRGERKLGMKIKRTVGIAKWFQGRENIPGEQRVQKYMQES